MPYDPRGWPWTTGRVPGHVTDYDEAVWHAERALNAPHGVTLPVQDLPTWCARMRASRERDAAPEDPASLLTEAWAVVREREQLLEERPATVTPLRRLRPWRWRSAA